MKTDWAELTIVTSCTGGYGRYLDWWVDSIIGQTVKPGRIIVVTHGSDHDDAALGAEAITRLTDAGLSAEWHHDPDRMDLGVARNCAVSYAKSEWVMHFDCDDALYPRALEEMERMSQNADVISAGYTQTGSGISDAIKRRERLYVDADGLKALDLSSICSGISPFRRSFWERSPYRTDMVGAWDTALWIGFARLGARFRATRRAVFYYRQHEDSIFNSRRRKNGWTRAQVSSQLKALRRDYSGVDVIVPRDVKKTGEREHVWRRVAAHYKQFHTEWGVVEGICPSRVWVKGAAIANALSRSKAEVIIVADADCLVDPAALRRSVEEVQQGAPWSMPHQEVYRACQTYTERVCAQSDMFPVLPAEDALDRPPYEGALGGGIFVMKRVWYDAIGGIPYAFQGWGSEDRALGTIANTLLGKCIRLEADLLHLWHPPQSQPEAAANLHVLRRIGTAAVRGKDELVVTLSSMPKATPQDPGTPSMARMGSVSVGRPKREEIIRTRRIP